MAGGEGASRNKALSHILKVEQDVVQAAVNLTAMPVLGTEFPNNAIGNAFKTAYLLAAVATASLVGVVAASVLELIRKRLFPWTEAQDAAGWKSAYTRFVADGWNALSCPAEFGGQNLPRALSALVEEMWNGANVAFALCPMLTRGTIDALDLRGSEVQKRTYLPRLVTGEWTGTMNLTEPQAGSDLSAVRTR